MRKRGVLSLITTDKGQKLYVYKKHIVLQKMNRFGLRNGEVEHCSQMEHPAQEELPCCLIVIFSATLQT